MAAVIDLPVHLTTDVPVYYQFVSVLSSQNLTGQSVWSHLLNLVLVLANLPLRESFPSTVAFCLLRMRITVHQNPFNVICRSLI